MRVVAQLSRILRANAGGKRSPPAPLWVSRDGASFAASRRLPGNRVSVLSCGTHLLVPAVIEWARRAKPGRFLCAVFGREIGTLAAGRGLPALFFGVFCHVHGGVGEAQKAIFGDGILRVEGDAHAGRAMQDKSLYGKGLVEAALE